LYIRPTLLQMKKALYALAAIVFLLMMTNPGHSSFQKFLGEKDKNTNRKANFLVCSIYSADDKSYFGILNEFYKIDQRNHSSEPSADSIKNGDSLQTENPLKTSD
jgi:hypothetical protein